MRIRPVLAVLASATLAVGLGVPAFAAPGDPRAELPGAASDRARQALDDVRALFDDGDRTAARGPAGSGPDATLALRDLMRVRGELTGAERREADGYLARPTDGAADPDGQGYAAGTTPRRPVTSTSACTGSRPPPTHRA